MTEEKMDVTDQEEIEDEQEPDRNVYIVPTSHVSENSSEQVREVVDSVNPDVIAVELDNQRLQKLISQDNFSNSSVKDIISKSDMNLKGSIILALFSKFQSKIASKLGIDVIGLDMMAGYEEASERDIPLALVDQDMRKTFKRFTDEITITESIKTIFSFLLAYVHISRKSKDDLENEVSSENIDIDEMLNHIERIFPTFKKVFLDERNEVITKKTSDVATQFDNTVLVIGAAHEPGVRKIFKEKYDTINVKELLDSSIDEDKITDNDKIVDE